MPELRGWFAVALSVADRHLTRGTAAVVIAALVAVGMAMLLWPRSGRRSRRDALSRVLSPADGDARPSESPTGLDNETFATSRATRPAIDDSARALWRRVRRSRSPPRAGSPTSDDVAGGMVLLAVALQSGCGIVEAIESAGAVAPARAGHELAVVAAALRWGVPEDQAWGAVSPLWRRASVALRLAAASGVAPSTLLLSGAEDLRAARLADVEVAAARLGVRLVGPLGLTFLPAFVLTTVVPVVVAIASHVLSA